jgi:hypothetical protein
LDVALPLNYNDDPNNLAFYFGRYFIFDERLVGIRLLCESDSTFKALNSPYKRWIKGKIATWKLPRTVTSYY